MFEKLGMTPCNAYEIVKDYFTENVINGSNELDYIKFLRIAYDMYVSYKARFGATASSEFMESENLDRQELYGWIDKKGNMIVINFRPQALKDYIIKAIGSKDAINRYETSLTQWRIQGILVPTRSLKKDTKDKYTDEYVYKNQKQIRTAHDDKQYVIQIPLEQFIKYLNLTDEPEEQPSDVLDNDEGDGEEPDEPIPKVSDEMGLPSVKVPQTSASVSPSSGGGFSQVSSVTASFDGNIVLHKTGDDTTLYELLSDLRGTGEEH